MKIAFILAALLAALPAKAGVIEGRVIEVPDGESLTVLSKEGASIHRVRLAGIDAPDKERAIGGTSRASLRRLVHGRNVRVEAHSIDSRGLLVGIVQVQRTAKDCAAQPCPLQFDPGLAQLASGLAKVDKGNVAVQPQQTQQLYATAEGNAKASRLGVWREAPTQRVRQDAAPPTVMR
jgi:endonuclease YncB( thermonuclease family)